MSQIVISHRSTDEVAAKQLKSWLDDKGFRCVFLDIDSIQGIPTGYDWEQYLYKELRGSEALILLLSDAWLESRWCFFEFAHARAIGRKILPLKISPCELGPPLSNLQVADLTTDPNAYQRLFESLKKSGLDPRDSFDKPKDRPPFPGMLAFDSEDAFFFFGREDETRDAIQKLTQMREIGGSNLAIVVGGSGSGKSSLVRAGIVPRLRKDPGTWLVVSPFRPSDAGTPLDALRLRLSEAFREYIRSPEMPAELIPGARAPLPSLTFLSDKLKELSGRAGATVLIVVDQAEKLFGNGKDEAPATDLFLGYLSESLGSSGHSTIVLFTLSYEFLANLRDHPALSGVGSDLLPLGPLSIDRIEDLVRKPAESVDIEVDSDLINTIKEEMKPGSALPLLAFALRELFERCKDRKRFTKDDWKQVGGIDGAIAESIRRVKNSGGLSEQTLPIVRRAFLKMIDLGDDGRYVGRPARWDTLPEAAHADLNKLVGSRLLVRPDGSGSVEIVHDRLFTAWEELKIWLDEKKELLLWRKAINGEFQGWLSAKEADKPMYLLRGARVTEARRWFRSNSEDFEGPQGDFLKASLEELARADEKERIRLESEKERLELAEKNVKVERRSRRLAIGLAIASLGLFGSSTSVWIIIDRQFRESQHRLAEALNKSIVLRDQARKTPSDPMPWDEASKQAIAVERLIEDSTDPGIASQVRSLETEVLTSKSEAKQDRSLLQSLAEIRSADADDPFGQTTDASYRDAFRRAGLETEPPSKATIDYLCSRPPHVITEVAAAVDHWISVRRKIKGGKARLRPLIDLAKSIDLNSFRNRVRDALSQELDESIIITLRSLLGEVGAVDLQVPTATLLARSLFDYNMVQDAIDLLKKAQYRSPGEPWVNYELAIYIQNSKQPDDEEDIRFYSIARALKPEMAHALGHVLERAHKEQEAIAVFRDLTIRSPHVGRHFGCLGRALKGVGEQPEAMAALKSAIKVNEEAVKLHPADVANYGELGNARLTLGDIDGAVIAYKQVLKLQPDSFLAHYNLASAYTKKKEYQNSVDSYLNSLKIIPNESDALEGIAFMYLKFLYDYKKSIEFFKKLCILRPKDSSYWLHLGVAYREDGDLENAIQANKNALQIDPDMAEARCNLGNWYKDQGSFKEALIELKRGDDLGSQKLSWRYPSRDWVRECEQLIELDGKLPAILTQDKSDVSPKALIAYASLCFYKKMYLESAEFYRIALEKKLSLEPEEMSQLMYNAALSAVTEGCGFGDDKRPKVESDLKLWRERAIDWLLADLKSLAGQFEAIPTEDRREFAKLLKQRKFDFHLAAVRSGPFFEGLSWVEKGRWREVWSEFDRQIKLGDTTETTNPAAP